jgi:hypothetical protein
MAWLAPHDAGGFHPLQTLLLEGLTHLTDAWNGVIATSPGGGTSTRVPRPTYGTLDVNVKGFRTIAGRLWVNVDVMSHPLCGSDTPPTVKARGWIPAHNQSGAPTVWFSSRGC